MIDHDRAFVREFRNPLLSYYDEEYAEVSVYTVRRSEELIDVYVELNSIDIEIDATTGEKRHVGFGMGFEQGVISIFADENATILWEDSKLLGISNKIVYSGDPNIEKVAERDSTDEFGRVIYEGGNITPAFYYKYGRDIPYIEPRKPDNYLDLSKVIVGFVPILGAMPTIYDIAQHLAGTELLANLLDPFNPSLFLPGYQYDVTTKAWDTSHAIFSDSPYNALVVKVPIKIDPDTIHYVSVRGNAISVAASHIKKKEITFCKDFLINREKGSRFANPARTEKPLYIDDSEMKRLIENGKLKVIDEKIIEKDNFNIKFSVMVLTSEDDPKTKYLFVETSQYPTEQTKQLKDMNLMKYGFVSLVVDERARVDQEEIIIKYLVPPIPCEPPLASLYYTDAYDELWKPWESKLSRHGLSLLSSCLSWAWKPLQMVGAISSMGQIGEILQDSPQPVKEMYANDAEMDVYDIFWEEKGFLWMYRGKKNVVTVIPIQFYSEDEETVAIRMGVHTLGPRNFIYSNTFDLSKGETYEPTCESLMMDKNTLIFKCPINATITDQYGRIISDDGINEIPDASMIITKAMKIFYLPADLRYTVDIDAYDSGTFNFTRISPIGSDISITKFENIPVTSSTKASVEIEPDVTDYTMCIDYDGDGTTDEEKSPDVSETIVNVGPENDYAKDSYIKVVSGTIAGQDISSNNPEITVSPAKKISGGFDISVKNTGHSGSIFPIVATPKWGPHESSYWSITGHQAPDIKTHTVNVDLNAPSKPGVYYIIVAGMWELSAANVASGTNWVVGENHWNDGNDLADWSTSMIEQAIKSGLVIADWEKVEGMVKMYVPATAIRVNVTEEPEKDVIEILIRSGKDDGYFMTFVSDSINDTSDILIGQVAADIFSLKFSTFMRFPNVAIPKDAKITKAYITVVPTFTNQSGPLMKITATDQSNPTIPKDYSDYSNRLRTKASVDWDASNWNEGVSVNSPDISSVIQELVDSYDYLTGAPILFFLDDADTEMRTKSQLFAAYEHTEHEPAKLHIEYITGGESESPLKITITSDKEEYSPGDNVTITATSHFHATPEEPIIITNPISNTFTMDGKLIFKDILPISVNNTCTGETYLKFDWEQTIPDDAPEGYYDVTVSFSGGKYVKTTENLFYVKAGNVPGDVTGDGRADYKDLVGVIEHWGAIDTKYDVDRSGDVGYSDTGFIMEHWTGSKPYGSAITCVQCPYVADKLSAFLLPGSSFRVQITTDGTVEAAHISVTFPSELKIESINVDPGVNFDSSRYRNGTDWIDVIVANSIDIAPIEAPTLAEICFTATEEGTYTINLSSVINGGCSITATFGPHEKHWVDTMAPTISNIKVSPTYALPGDSINISANVFDSSGIRWVRAFISKGGEHVVTVFMSDSDGDGVYTGTWHTCIFTESGIYNVDISATDTEGNEALAKGPEIEIA